MGTFLVPELDEQLCRRLARRFGPTIEEWLDGLPPVLTGLANRWHLVFESLIQRGTVSVVIRCRTADGRSAVLKISPDRTRIADEARALARWHTGHVPGVLAVDESHGALLIEAIEPGTPLLESGAYPSFEMLGQLVQALHGEESPVGSSYPPVAQRIANLYKSGTTNYERRPDLADVISPELYEQGRELAMRLASDARSAVILHGDLTPANILDGGQERGLVAIDPAPHVGDPGFDVIDLVLWQADDCETVAVRAARFAPFLDVEATRLLDWCAAFAAMSALELAEASTERPHGVDFLVALAADRT